METIKCTKCELDRIIVDELGVCTPCREADEQAYSDWMKSADRYIEAADLKSNLKYKGPGAVPAKELDSKGKLKHKGRGGKRPGAGRPYLEPHQEADRKITKSITLSASTWEYLQDHSTDSLSKAIEALIQFGTSLTGHSSTAGQRADAETLKPKKSSMNISKRSEPTFNSETTKKPQPMTHELRNDIGDLNRLLLYSSKPATR